jgi:hypothetical protein
MQKRVTMREYNERIHWTIKKAARVPRKHKVVWVEEEDDGTLFVYYTASPFWYYFFHPNEGAGKGHKKCKKVLECTKKVPIPTHKRIKCDDPNELAYWM